MEDEFFRLVSIEAQVVGSCPVGDVFQFQGDCGSGGCRDHEIGVIGLFG